MSKRKNLLLFRLDNNLTQQEMANKLGITRVHYNSIENGKADPSFSLCQKLNELFEINDVWDLMKKN